MNNQEKTLKPRIYVACLASYNSGFLHGDWIDADMGEEEIHEEIEKILKSSPIEDAEEFAIHDYDNFWEAELGEYPGIETVAKVAEFLADHGRLGARAFDCCNQDLDEARKMMEEQYLGEYTSLEEYAREYLDGCGNVPDDLEYYFDYERYGRDLEMGGSITTLETSFREIHIFMAC